jgi:hypothetical protein
MPAESSFLSDMHASPAAMAGSQKTKDADFRSTTQTEEKRPVSGASRNDTQPRGLLSTIKNTLVEANKE